MSSVRRVEIKYKILGNSESSTYMWEYYVALLDREQCRSKTDSITTL